MFLLYLFGVKLIANTKTFEENYFKSLIQLFYVIYKTAYSKVVCKTYSFQCGGLNLILCESSLLI